MQHINYLFRVGFESTENSQLLASGFLSKYSFKSNVSYALQLSKKKSSSDTIVNLKSVALQKSSNSTILRGLKSGNGSDSNLQSDKMMFGFAE